MTDEEEEKRLAKIKTLARVVCICKGIQLKHVLPALEGSDSIEAVNKKAGTGSGGCNGQRCGPRIKILLEKYAESKEDEE
jgi:bacterioferritin-associated ferredoxin